jgi:DNA mismatch endonuclease (patch repair protein)
MSRIRSTETKPEIIVRQYLFKNGFRYRKNVNNLPGKPDVVLSKYNTVIMVNGCFWHGHNNCKYAAVPKTRTKWWINKISKNKENDNLNRKKLKKLGYNTIVIWECELKKQKVVKTCDRLSRRLLKIFI